MTKEEIKEDAPTNCVGDGSKVSGMTPSTVGVRPGKLKKILTFKQMMSRKNAKSD